MNKIIQGDSLQVLRTLESESIDCVITSPPYWNLRDYGTAAWQGGNITCKHNAPSRFDYKLNHSLGPKRNQSQDSNKGSGSIKQYRNICGKCGAKRIDQQLGLESSFKDYIIKLCDIFDEVKRVLKKEGTCWVNLGDTYGGSKVGNTDNRKNRKVLTDSFRKIGGTNKSLCQIPSRFAIEMCDRGWILRNKIIWHKPNVMPQSMKDRFTVDFEEVFFFVKSDEYYFEQQREPLAAVSIERVKHGWKSKKANASVMNGKGIDVEKMGERFANPLGRNKRAVWKIPTSSSRFTHIAMFPEALIEPMIQAGCPRGGVRLGYLLWVGDHRNSSKETRKRIRRN